KLLSGNLAAVSRSLTVIDLWENRLRQIRLDDLRQKADCRCCQHREFPWLAGERSSQTAVLCGRNAVQLSPPAGVTVSLEELAPKLATAGQVTQNRHLLRLSVDPYQITLFPDGRAIIGGTDDIAEARTVYARYVGA